MQRIRDIVCGLEDKIEVLDDLIEEEISVIRFHIRNQDKNKAMVSIKKKKGYEIQIKELNNKIESINFIISKMDQSLTDMEVIEAQKHTSEEIKKILGSSTIDKTENHVDNIQDQMKQIDEMSITITQSNLNFVFDERELDDEYNEFLGDQSETQENVKEVDISKTNIAEFKVPKNVLPNKSVLNKTTPNKKVLVF
jgi:hypothetical protein